MIRTPYTIAVNQSEMGTYLVEVLPTPDGVGHDREFNTRKAAWSYASGLRLVTGWKAIDLTGNGAAHT